MAKAQDRSARPYPLQYIQDIGPLTPVRLEDNQFAVERLAGKYTRQASCLTANLVPSWFGAEPP